MYNPTQPFINLAGANMAAFTRLAQSHAVAVPKNADADAYLQQAKGLFDHAIKADALVEWTKTTVANYATFLNEVTDSVLSVVGEGKAFVAEKTKELSKGFQKGLDDVTDAKDAALDAMNTETAKVKRKAA